MANNFIARRTSHLKWMIIMIVAFIVLGSGGYGVYAKYFSNPLVERINLEAGTTQLCIKDVLKEKKRSIDMSMTRILSETESKDVGEHDVYFQINRRSYKTTINVVDTTAPKIKGAKDLKVEAGSTISYKKDVKVTDNASGEIALDIDSSAVDLNKKGVYPVIYKATDASGNTTTKEIKVTVFKLSQVEVAHQRTIAKAQAILDRITNPSDSKATKLRKAFMWVRRTRYTSPRRFPRNFRSGLWPSTYANDVFDRKRGDCHSMSAAMAYLGLVIGYENVYLKQDHRTAGGGAHTWAVIDGKCYDPLFSVMKCYGWSKGWAVPERRTVYRAARSRRITMEKILA